MTNSEGQRAGYVGGNFYEEIPGSAVAVIGDAKLVFVPNDEDCSILLRGVDSGKATLWHMSSRGATDYIQIDEIPSVTVSERTTMEMSYRAGGHTSPLRIDRDGDGTVDAVVKLVRRPRGLEVGAIIGIIVGTLGLIAAGFLVFRFLRSRYYI